MKNKEQKKISHHQVLASQTHRVNGSLQVDGGLLLWAVGVWEVDLRSCALHDVLDVAAVAAHHEEVVLGRNVKLRADRDGTGQVACEVLQ